MIPRNMYIWIYLSYAIHPGGLELATFHDTTACPPKKKGVVENALTSPRNMKGSQVADAPWEVGAYTSQRCSHHESHIEEILQKHQKNKKTNPRCSHLKCEQLFKKKSPKTPEDHNYMYLLEVSSSSSIIFFQILHWISYGLPEEIWTHRPSSTTQPESWWSKRIDRKTTQAWWRD